MKNNEAITLGEDRSTTSIVVLNTYITDYWKSENDIRSNVPQGVMENQLVLVNSLFSLIKQLKIPVQRKLYI